jgi:hypothetical protein
LALLLAVALVSGFGDVCFPAMVVDGIFSVQVYELYCLANAGCVDDDLTPILPPHFSTHVCTLVKQPKNEELMPVDSGAKLLQ